MKHQESSHVWWQIVTGGLATILLALYIIHGPNFIDRTLLVEYVHPGYVEYLSPERALQVEVLPDFENISTEQMSEANIITTLNSLDYNGIQVRSKGGKIRFWGTATEATWLRVDPMTLELEAGEYFIGIGKNYPINAKVYLEGLKDGKSTVITNIYDQPFFYVKKSAYNGYVCTVQIDKGKTVDFELSPMLYRIGKENLSHDLVTYTVWRDIPIGAITDKDIRIFEKGLYHYTASKACVIKFLDGSALAYSGYQNISVCIDDYGRILLE